MSDTRKLAEEPYFSEFTSQANFQPGKGSIYLALGTGLLETVVRNPEDVSAPIIQKMLAMLADTQAQIIDYLGQESLHVLINLVEVLRSPVQPISQRLQWLDGFVTSNHQGAGTALQLYIRLCLAQWLPHHRATFLDFNQLPPSFSEFLGKYCQEFGIFCQLSQASHVARTFGSAHGVPAIFLHMKNADTVSLLYHPLHAQQSQGCPVNTTAFPFVVHTDLPAQSPDELLRVVEALAQHSIRQATFNAELVQLLTPIARKYPQATALDELIAQWQTSQHNQARPPQLPETVKQNNTPERLGMPPVLPGRVPEHPHGQRRGFSPNPPYPQQRDLRGSSNAPLHISQIVHPHERQPISRTAIPSGSGGAPNLLNPLPDPSILIGSENPIVPPVLAPQSVGRKRCVHCTHYKDAEYFELIVCSGHDVCSECRAQAFSQGQHACPICRREYSDNEVLLLNFVAADDGQKFTENESSFLCLECNKKKNRKFKAPCPGGCRICNECFFNSRGRCSSCKTQSTVISCSGCEARLGWEYCELAPCKHLMHSHCVRRVCHNCRA